MDYAKANVTLKLGGIDLEASVPVPTGQVSNREMLPLYRAFTDAIVKVGVSFAEKEGRAISCKAGCGACCRQLVPISFAEAEDLRDLVDNMDEPRRTEIRQRFAAARERLAQEGMLERLEAGILGDAKSFQEFALRYFALGIPCPFLENESCSIYERRPLKCREFLVVSDPKHCAEPTPKAVEGVEMPATPSLTVMRMGTAPDDTARWTTLTLAMEWPDSHKDIDPRPGTDFFREFLGRLTKSTPEEVVKTPKQEKP